ncbi:MAG: hypothetical protein IKX37_02105 [Bacteroidales bacterium]|nr:hypothetical protein [Bacteroidales bacterium]
MKKLFVAILALTLFPLLALSQELRYNYKTGGITRVSTEYEFVQTGDADQHPFWMRLEYVKFKDGSVSYVLYLNFEEKKAVNIPKGVRIAVTPSDGGKIINADQMYAQKGNKHAFTSGKGRVYWNRAQYMFDAPDMQRMVKGVKALDVITGWNAEDYVQITYASNQLGKVLAAHYNAVNAAAPSAVAIAPSGILDYDSKPTALTVKAKPSVATGEKYKYNVAVTYLYYKGTNTEDVELEFQLGTEKEYRIHLSTPVVFELGGGEKLVLEQAREDISRVVVYPTLVQARKMISKGIKAVTYTLDSGAVTDTFSGPSFTDAFSKGYQTVMSVAER